MIRYEYKPILSSEDLCRQLLAQNGDLERRLVKLARLVLLTLHDPRRQEELRQLAQREAAGQPAE